MPRHIHPASPSSKENSVVAPGHQLGGGNAGPRRRLQPLGEHKPSNLPFKKAWGREEDITIKADGAVKWLDGAASVCYRSRVQKEVSMVPPGQTESPKQGKHGETCPPLTPTRGSSSAASAPPAEPSCSPDIIRKKGSRDLPVAEGCFGIGPSVQGSVIDRRKSKPRALLTVEPLPNVATLVCDDEQQSRDLPRPGRASLEWISDDDSIADFSGTCDGSRESVCSGLAQQGLSKNWEDFKIGEIYEKTVSSQQLFRKGEHFKSDDSLADISTISLRTLLQPPSKSRELIPKCVKRVAALENNDGFVEHPIFATSGATLNVHVSDEPDSNQPATASYDPTFVGRRRLQNEILKTRTLPMNRSCYGSEVDTVMGAYESCVSTHQRMGVEREVSGTSSVSKPSPRKQSRDSGMQSNHNTPEDRYSGRTSQEMEGIHEAEYCKPKSAGFGKPRGGNLEARLKVADALHKLTAQFERASDDMRPSEQSKYYKCSSHSTVDTTSANGSGSLSKQVDMFINLSKSRQVALINEVEHARDSDEPHLDLAQTFFRDYCKVAVGAGFLVAGVVLAAYLYQRRFCHPRR